MKKIALLILIVLILVLIMIPMSAGALTNEECQKVFFTKSFLDEARIECGMHYINPNLNDAVILCGTLSLNSTITNNIESGKERFDLLIDTLGKKKACSVTKKFFRRKK